MKTSIKLSALTLSLISAYSFAATGVGSANTALGVVYNGVTGSYATSTGVGVAFSQAVGQLSTVSSSGATLVPTTVSGSTGVTNASTSGSIVTSGFNSALNYSTGAANGNAFVKDIGSGNVVANVSVVPASGSSASTLNVATTADAAAAAAAASQVASNSALATLQAAPATATSVTTSLSANNLVLSTVIGESTKVLNSTIGLDSNNAPIYSSSKLNSGSSSGFSDTSTGSNVGYLNSVATGAGLNVYGGNTDTRLSKSQVNNATIASLITTPAVVEVKAVTGVLANAINPATGLVTLVAIPEVKAVAAVAAVTSTLTASPTNIATVSNGIANNNNYSVSAALSSTSLWLNPVATPPVIVSVPANHDNINVYVRNGVITGYIDYTSGTEQGGIRNNDYIKPTYNFTTGSTTIIDYSYTVNPVVTPNAPAINTVYAGSSFSQPSSFRNINVVNY